MVKAFGVPGCLWQVTTQKLDKSKAHLQSTRLVCTLQINTSWLQALARYTPLGESARAVVAPVALGSNKDEVLAHVLREIVTISG